MPSKHKKKHNKSATPAAAKTPSTDVHLTPAVTTPSCPIPPLLPSSTEAEPPDSKAMAPVQTTAIVSAAKGSKSETPVLVAVKTLLNVIENYNGKLISTDTDNSCLS